METQKALAFMPTHLASRKDLDIRSGDTVRVYVKIEEKGKTRLQMFEGLVLATKHGKEAGATFTVRKISNGVGVERVFPLYSPDIDKIEVVRRAKTRRSKLYFLRTKTAREMRRKMRNLIPFLASSEDLVPEESMIEETKEEDTPKGTDEKIPEETGAEKSAEAESQESKEESPSEPKDTPTVEPFEEKEEKPTEEEKGA